MPRLQTKRRAWKAGPNYPRIRKAVLVRDNFTCWLCGGRADAVDHVLPYALGGSNRPSNLRAVCGECNSKKGDYIGHLECETTKDWLHGYG